MKLAYYDMQWILRRLPTPVIRLLRKHPKSAFLAGGFVRACVANEPVNDVDLFAPSKELAKAYAEEVGGKLYETENAYSLVDSKPMVQVVHRWTYDSAEPLLASFDVTVACAAVWFDETWQSMCHKDFYADLAAKRLVYLSPKRDEAVGGSFLRLLKFYQRGYRAPLESVDAIVSRLFSAVDAKKLEAHPNKEQQAAKVLTGLLREVDPNVNPESVCYLEPYDEQEVPPVHRDTAGR